nr:hypothetical protein [Tanacetum cinerariifolium]
ADDEVPTNMALMAFSDSKLDLSNSGLEEFQQPEFEGYGPKTSNSVSEDISNDVKESTDSPLVKKLVSDYKLEKKTIFSTVTKIELLDLNNKKRQLGNQSSMLKCTGHNANYNYHQREMVVSWHNYTRVNYNYSTKKAHPSAHRLKAINNARQNSAVVNVVRENQINDNPQLEFQEKEVIDSGCSRNMTRNMSYLSEYEEFDGEYVAFGGDPKGGKITGKGKISIDTECVVLSPDFKLLDESQVLLRVPRKNNMYSVDLKNVAHSRGLTCLFVKATLNESNLWHRRLGHINFKTMNKLGVDQLGFFDIDTLTKSMNYKPVVEGINLMVVQDSPGDEFKPSGKEEKKDAKDPGNEDNEVLSTEKPRVNQDNVVDRDIVYGCDDDPNMPNLEEINYSYDDEDVGAEADMTNLDTNIHVGPISTTRIHKDHPVEQIIRDIHSVPQTRRMTKNMTNYASTPMETSKPLLKDEHVEDVNVHLYRSIIGSLMYLTSSRPDIMFVVCACARFQVTSIVSHLHAVKRIFRYLKGQPKLGLWYPKDSPFDRKPTTGGC